MASTAAPGAIVSDVELPKAIVYVDEHLWLFGLVLTLIVLVSLI